MKISKVGGMIAVANREVAKPLLQVGTIPLHPGLPGGCGCQEVQRPRALHL